MVEKRGLGRGLSALLEEASEAPEDGGIAPERDMPIELIRRNPDQPRKHFDEDEINELAASIRRRGILQPILVRPGVADGEYQIVAGERRWRAAQKAGLREVPVIIRTLDESEVLEIGILENVQRSDLNAVEEAAAYRTLMQRFGHTQDLVAEMVGKSRSHVANTLRLLSLPEQVQAWVIEGKLTAGHARAVMGAPDPLLLARQIIDNGLSVREAEALAKRAAAPASASSKPSAQKDADTRALERRLSEILGLIVSIEDRGGKGEVRVKYATLEQLEAVCGKLSG